MGKIIDACSYHICSSFVSFFGPGQLFFFPWTLVVVNLYVCVQGCFYVPTSAISLTVEDVCMGMHGELGGHGL